MANENPDPEAPSNPSPPPPPAPADPVAPPDPVAPAGAAPPPAAKKDEKPDKPQTFGQRAWEFVKTWGPALAAIILIRTFIFEPFSIPSQSMVPTLLIGDFVFVTKFSYGLWVRFPFTQVSWEMLDLGDPEPGDIIVFKFPRDPHPTWMPPLIGGGDLNYIKRVVAVPGDEVMVRDNVIYINGIEQKMTSTGTANFQDDQCDPQEALQFEEDLGGVKHTVLRDRSGGGQLKNHAAEKVPDGHVFVMGDNRDHSGDSREWGMVDERLIKGKAHFIWLSWNSCGETVSSKIRTERIPMGLN